MNEIDLHGFTHDEAVFATEDWLLRESLDYGFQVKIITGNSHPLQKRIIEEVLKNIILIIIFLLGILVK